MKMNRRRFVQRTGLTGLSLAALGLLPQRAQADPDPVPGQTAAPSAATELAEPAILPFRLGDLDAFVVHDGFLGLPTVQPMFAPEARPSEIEELLKRHFLPPHRAALSVNVLVLKGKEGISLFDTGTGVAFGPAMGRLLRGLAKLGIGPGDVKTIYLTHAHADHIGGLVDAKNQSVFQNARIVAALKEVEFWTAPKPDLSGMRTPEKTKSETLSTIQKFLGGVKAQLDLREPCRLSSEVELLAAPGHTPGHSYYLVKSGGDQLLVFGDAVHLSALQFAHPEWTMIYDVNPEQAIATRRKLFKRASSDRTLCLGAHMPFPGLGHVQSEGKAYAWVPRPWVV